MSHESSRETDSSKEVQGHHGMEVVQPGLIPLYPSQFENNYNNAEISHEPAKPKPRICGLRKVTFWLVLGLAALAVVAIGLGAGLGVGLSRARNEATASDREPKPSGNTGSGTSLDEPPPTSTISTTSGGSSTSSTASSPSSTGTSVPSTICPSANNTIVTQGKGSIRYRIFCDSDYAGSGKETLASIVLTSFDDCLRLCNTMNYFQDRADVGCTFNVAGTGSQSPGTCWCLGGDKGIVTNVGNDVAQPL